MTRVQCKDEGHDGDSAWVDREDCLLVPRFGGGAYNRAGRMIPTTICLACTSRYVAEIERGEHRGARKVNRWSKSGLTYQYAQFRRRVGLPERTPMSNEPKTTPEGIQDDSEATIAVPWDDLPEEERQAWIDAAKPGFFPTKYAQGKADYERANREEPKAPHLAYGGLVPRKPGEFHHHFTAKLPASKCVFCGGSIYETCRGPRADEWEARMQARRELKERIFSLAYGRSPEGHAEAADAMAEFNAETLRLFPDRFRKPTPEEQEARERFRELVSAPLTPTFQQTAADAIAIDLEGPEEYLGEDAAPRSHEVMGIDASMPLTDWVRRALGIELTDAQRAEYEARDRQAPGVALDGYEAVNSAEEERMAQELMEEHGYRPKEGALVPTSDVRQMLVEAHRTATDEYDRILTRQSDLLTNAVTALRGDPPELVWWSHHDVAELAQAAVQTIARILAKPLEWSNVKPENKDYYLAQARQMIVEETDNG